MSEALRSAAMGPTEHEREIIRRIFDFDEQAPPKCSMM